MNCTSVADVLEEEVDIHHTDEQEVAFEEVVACEMSSTDHVAVEEVVHDVDYRFVVEVDTCCVGHAVASEVHCTAFVVPSRAVAKELVDDMNHNSHEEEIAGVLDRDEALRNTDHSRNSSREQVTYHAEEAENNAQVDCGWAIVRERIHH